MKRLLYLSLGVLVLSGCLPVANDETEVLNTEEEVETAIIPSIQLDDQYYRTLLPYKESVTRGTIVSRLNSRYDIKEAESGLLRMSQQQFSPEDYYFQEGQKITSEELTNWLRRYDAENNPDGLNPENTLPEGSEERPPASILAHVVEQNYLVKTDEDTIRLGGVSIGLALNSVYYNRINDVAYEEEIPSSRIVEEGQRMANEIVARLREKEGMAKVPIVVGLFKQNSRSAITPGTYFSYGTAGAEQTAVGNWNAVSEEYVIFPSSRTEEKYRTIDTKVRNFKQATEKYFSNFTSVVGTGFYQGDELRQLKIEIPIEFYGAAEIIGFTQYVTGLVIEHFPENIQVEVSVTSMNGPEALILRKVDQTEPVVHIYD